MLYTGNDIFKYNGNCFLFSNQLLLIGEKK